MSNLKRYKFNELYEIGSGISSKPEQAGHGFPFLSFSSVFNNQFMPESLSDLMDTSDTQRMTYSVQQGDIFLTRTSETIDELGMSCVATEEIPNATYSGFLKRLRPTQSDVSYHKFMGFYLRSKLFRKTMSNNAVMTLRASFNEDMFSYLDLLLPEYPKQKKIGDYLYLLNQKIETNNKMNAELEAMAKLIYDYWFVQFDFPDEDGKPYKSSGGKMVYSEELKQDIPEAWEVKSLMDIASFTNGVACQKHRPQDGADSYRVIKIREMGGGFTDSSEWVSKSIPDKVVVNNGDVLFSWSATLSVMIWAGGIGGLNQHIFKVTSDKYPRTFYYFEVLRYLEHFKMMAELRKTTMGHITQDHLKQSRISIPDDGLVESLHEKLNPMFQQMVCVLEENQKLAELRDWLLPMLMNGQVTVE
tara:strand:+ start:190 stop:1437 length:1248 start_codon:yes stop_codon:yes gene_type:complete